MWAIALFTDPKSKLYNLPNNLKRQIINKETDKTFDENREPYKEQIALYQELCLTKAARLLTSWEKKLEEVHKVIDNAEMNIETAKLILGMMADLKNAWKHYAEVKKQFQDEQEDQIFGGAQESLSEAGII